MGHDFGVLPALDSSVLWRCPCLLMLLLVYKWIGAEGLLSPLRAYIVPL